MNLSDLPKTSATPDSRGGVHTVEWKDNGLKATISKLREQSNGGLLADFDLHLKAGGELTGPFKYFSRFNFKSALTKSSTAKDLARVAPEPVIADEAVWRYVIEYASNYVRVAFNEGEAGVQLIDSTASEDTEFRLWPYFQERQPSVVFGDGGSGKSYFCLLAGFLIATGREHLGMKPEPGSVLYLDYENGEGTILGRLRKVAAGFGETTPPFIHYMAMRRPLEDDFDRVSAYLLENCVDFVVVDHGARAVFEAEQSGPVNQYFNALAGLEVSSVTVAHISKAGKESEPFGSSFWHNNARATYRALAQESGDTLNMALRQYKSNNAPRISDRAFQFTFEDTQVVVGQGDLDAIPRTEENVPMHRRIVNYLSNNGGPVTAADLAQTLDSSRGYVATVLNRELKGKVVHLPDGRWGLSIS